MPPSRLQRAPAASTLPHVRLLPAVLAALIALPVPVAAAQQAPAGPDVRGVSVLPTADSPYRSSSGQYLELGTVPAGAVVGDQVVVVNAGDVQRELLLFAVDASPAAGGGYGYSSRRSPQAQVGAWTTLSLDRVTLPPRGRASLSFELRVPAGAQAGSYVGGIVAEPVSGQEAAVSVTTRYAMPVVLEVAGAPPGTTPGRGTPGGRLQLDDVELQTDGDQLCPIIRYRNDSQDPVDPVAEVHVDRLVGSDERSARLPAGVVGAGEARDAELPCVRRPLGPATVSVELRSPRGDARQELRTSWLPWPFVLALLFLVLLVAALLLLLLRGLRRRREQRAVPDADGPGHS